MASANQTRPHCVNQMGKTHSKPLAARHGRGMAWARHAMCESALRIQVHCGYHTSLQGSCLFQLTFIHFDDTSMMTAYITVPFTRYVKDVKEILGNCKFLGFHTGVIVDYGSLRRDVLSLRYVAPDTLQEGVTSYPQ